MLKVWGLIRKNNRIVQDMVAECQENDIEQEEALYSCVHEICYEFDLQRPIWLPKNQREYEDYKRIVLTQDNFIEPIDFDTLELEILSDEDEKY